MKTKSVVRYLPLYAALIAFAVMLACSPERYVPACFEGLALWAKCVAPALFPFMVITLLLIKTGGADMAARPLKRACSFLGLPPDGAVIFIMSVFSGYPAGSRIVYEYCEDGRISAGDAQKLAPICSTSGPLFLLGSVGQSMLGNKAQGAIIFAAHIISVLTIGLIICLCGRKKVRREKPSPLPSAAGGNILYNAFYSAVMSVLVAGGFICFFYTLSCAARDAGLLLFLEAPLTHLLGEGADTFCYGLIEATGGCAGLAAHGGAFALPLMGFLITFGGCSIIAQQLCYLLKCGVKPLKFIGAKAAQGALCFVLLLPLVAA